MSEFSHRRQIVTKRSNVASPLALEAGIHELTLAAEIAFDAAMDDAEVGDKTLFAIEQFERMAKDLKEKFYGRI
jgi:hypothetical protein